MGAGKSAIGRLLAVKTDRTCMDSDSEIVRSTGADIDLIFEKEGEESFRKRESWMIEKLSALDDIVLATGGGAVLNKDNRDFLAKRGKIVYLKASSRQLLERTSKDRKRPFLQTNDRLATLEELLRIREPLYMELADIIIKTDDRSIKQVVDCIIRQT